MIVDQRPLSREEAGLRADAEDAFHSGEILAVMNLEIRKASVDGADAGYLSIERHKAPPSDLDGFIVFNLQKLYLLLEYHGLGCGSALLSFAEEQMRLRSGEVSRTCYELNVNRHNPAVSFYRRHGLSIVREGDFAIGNGFYMNDFIMRKEL